MCSCVQVHIEFTDGEERISLEGPTEEVEQAQAQIQEIIKDLVSLSHTQICKTGFHLSVIWIWKIVIGFCHLVKEQATSC